MMVTDFFSLHQRRLRKMKNAGIMDWKLHSVSLTVNQQTVKEACVLLMLLLLYSTQVMADECGTRFTDPTSSAVRALVVMQGSVGDMNPHHEHTNTHSANVTIGEVYKGMDILQEAGLTSGSMVMVSQFSEEEDKDNCIASMEAMGHGSEHIFFLRPTPRRHMMQISALPLPMEEQVETRVRRSLCATCVRPPHIEKITCRNCASAPVMKKWVETKRAKEGKRARLRCSAKGQPRATYTWFNRGIPIVSGSGGKSIKNKTKASILFFRRANRADSGQYTCVASNAIGKVEAVVTLQVLPNIRKTANPKRVRINTPGTPDDANAANNPFISTEANSAKATNTSASLSNHVQQKNDPMLSASDSASQYQNNNLSESSIERLDVTSKMESSQPESMANNSHLNVTSYPDSTTDLDDSSSVQTSINSAPRLPEPSFTATNIYNNNNDNNGSSAPRTTISDPKNIISRLEKTHLKIVTCLEKHYCKNGGRCKLVKKINIKFCACSRGFAGIQCEIVDTN